MATTSATGEPRCTIAVVAADVVPELELELDLGVLPAAAAGVLLAAELAEVVAVGVAVAATAVVRVEVTCPEVPIITLPTSSLAVHLPSRLLNLDASVTAAGVEPQLLYCCM